jgi:hypothetical protein
MTRCLVGHRLNLLKQLNRERRKNPNSSKAISLEEEIGCEDTEAGRPVHFYQREKPLQPGQFKPTSFRHKLRSK